MDEGGEGGCKGYFLPTKHGERDREEMTWSLGFIFYHFNF